jgi:hypothetical protein
VRNRPPATSRKTATGSPKRPRPWTHVAFAPLNEYLILLSSHDSARDGTDVASTGTRPTMPPDKGRFAPGQESTEIYATGLTRLQMILITAHSESSKCRTNDPSISDTKASDSRGTQAVISRERTQERVLRNTKIARTNPRSSRSNTKIARTNPRILSDCIQNLSRSLA